MKYFLKQLQFVKPKDILAGFLFIFALPVSWIYKLKRKNMWLVCERTSEARDNGYWFYKYVCENHPEQDVVYAIKSDSVDYNKVASLGGEIIEFGSFKHWVYYLTADINISSQKEGKPNAAMCHFLEIYGFLKNRRVFLQHGIIKDDLKWLYYDVTKMWLFTCSTRRELDYCEEQFSYPKGIMKLVGMCRYDNLDVGMTEDKTIFIMPTMRVWLSRPVKSFEKYDDIYNFSKTHYYQAWCGVLTHEGLNALIRERGLNVVFFLHPNMQKYVNHFKDLSTNVKIRSADSIDIQDMLKRSALLITDYSSVYFDMAYMNKPVIYYQFDNDKYREGHYQEGYFSYCDDGFGPVVETADEVYWEIEKLVNAGMKMPELYARRARECFAYRDTRNCERVYNAIVEKRASEK